MIGTMGSAVGAGAVAGGAAGPGAAGVVARPRLFGRLGAQARVSVVSASAGSGKTVLLRSWIGQAGVAERAAWVPAERGERDPQRFWLSVLAALRQTAAGSALSLAGHPDPERLAAEFSGTERTVAEYVLAEVLDRQPEQVRRLLLRTSILERVNGELVGLLTGNSGVERVLQDLEAANAFVVAVDAGRSWFRYHHLF